MTLNLRVALEISARPFDDEVKEEKPYSCCVCSRSFSGMGFLKAHFQRTHKNEQFHPPIVIKKDNPLPQQPDKLVSRTKIFKSKFSSDSASCSTSPLFAVTEEPIICQRCNKSFTKRYDFLKHRFVHPTIPIALLSYTKNFGGLTVRDLFCKTCKKIFGRYNDYKFHFSVKCELCMTVHCREWLYMKELCSNEKECNICLRELCEKCHLLHRNEPVREVKSEKCVVCNEVCKDKTSLKDHYIKVHELTKISLCP